MADRTRRGPRPQSRAAFRARCAASRWALRSRLAQPTKLRIVGVVGPLPQPRCWVFLVGCYNSGTTLLHDLLARHPDIAAMPGEGQFFTDQMPIPKRLGFARNWVQAPDVFRLTADDATDIDVSRLKRQWGARFNAPDRAVLLEKSPTNAARTRWLEQHFTNAHFIGIVRNGYAVAEGIHRKAGEPLEAAARQWSVSNEMMLEDFDHLARRRIVSYEQLVSHPTSVLGELFGFLGLDAAAVDLEPVLAGPIRVHERADPVSDLNAASLERLSGDDIATIHRIAGPMLHRLGYA